MQRVTDRKGGFTLEYPSSWNVYTKANDPNVNFIAGPDTKDTVLVRVFQNLGLSFAPGDSQAEKQVVDALLANLPISMISTTAVTYGGMSGWEYVYSFVDQSTQQVGVHIHLFLFQKYRLHTIVFQALPNTKLKSLARTFDQILSSYRALPLPVQSPTPIGNLPTPAASPTPTP
jgi:hypothetical protein